MSKKEKKNAIENKNTYYKKLIEEVALSQFKELSIKAYAITFEEAFKNLDGNGLEANATTINGELISVELSFEVYYKNIKGTIFNADGECELGESWEFMIEGDEVAIVDMNEYSAECVRILRN